MKRLLAVIALLGCHAYEAPSRAPTESPVRQQLSWLLGVLAPNGTPKPAIDWLNREMRHSLRGPQRGVDAITGAVFLQPTASDSAAVTKTTKILLRSILMRLVIPLSYAFIPKPTLKQ